MTKAKLRFAFVLLAAVFAWGLPAQIARPSFEVASVRLNTTNGPVDSTPRHSDNGGDDARLRTMLQSLLSGRFGLQAHRERKEMQIYAVTLAKGGPKFHASMDEGPPVFDRGGPTTLTARRFTMKDLALRISDPLRRPVIDETGLTGRYDIRIDVSGYMIDQAKGEGGGPPPDLMSLLFKGLQEQLGIKLESKKENVDLLVIDHAEKMPTDN